MEVSVARSQQNAREPVLNMTACRVLQECVVCKVWRLELRAVGCSFAVQVE